MSSEELKIRTIRDKLSLGKPFLNCGPVLIVTNPFKETDNFGDELADFYHAERDSDSDAGLASVAHLFAKARAMRQMLVLEEQGQIAVFMGFSGSGKSYAADAMIRQCIRPFSGTRPPPTSTEDQAPLHESITKALGLMRRAISAGSVLNHSSTRCVFEVNLTYKLPTAGQTRVGTLVGAGFNVHGLERWRVALRRPVSIQESPFFLLNEVLAALVCTGFGSDAQRVIENAWKSDEKEFLSALAFSCLNREDSAFMREWGVSFEATVATLLCTGMANIQVANLFRVMSAVVLLSNIDFNSIGGNNPLSLAMRSGGASWTNSTWRNAWPEDFGANVRCNLNCIPVPDASAIFDAEANRRPKVKQIMKKAGRAKSDSTNGLALAPEKSLFSSSLASMLPAMAHIGMSQEMMRVAAVQGGFKDLPSRACLDSSLQKRLSCLGDRAWISPDGCQVNAVIIDIVADFLEVESLDLYSTLTQPTLKEKTVNVGTTQGRCDVTAAALYTGIVDSIVEAMQLHFACDTSNTNIITILDTPGLEVSEPSHFTQLVRNLYAEMFNGFYVTRIFTKFEKLCRDESLDWTPAEYHKTSPQVLDTVFGMAHLKTGSVKDVIDAVTLSSAPAARYDWSKDFMSSMKDLAKSSTCISFEEDTQSWDTWNSVIKNKEKILKKDKKLLRDAEMACWRFVVNHYSGKVSYSAETWVETDRCVLTQALEQILESSSSSVVRHAAETSRQRKSVLSDFQEIERSMLTSMGTSRNYFFQCIRPNDSQQPLKVDWDAVCTQVRAMQLGPLGDTYGHNVHVSYTFAEFIAKFKHLPVKRTSSRDEDICRAILEAANVTDFRMGKAVLLSNPSHWKLIEMVITANRQSAAEVAAANKRASLGLACSPAGARTPGRGPAKPVEFVGGEEMYLDLSEVQAAGQSVYNECDYGTAQAGDVGDDLYLDLGQMTESSTPDPDLQGLASLTSNQVLTRLRAESTSAGRARAESTSHRSEQSMYLSSTDQPDDDLYLDLSAIDSVAPPPVAPPPVAPPPVANGDSDQPDDDLYLDLSSMNTVPPPPIANGDIDEPANTPAVRQFRADSKSSVSTIRSLPPRPQQTAMSSPSPVASGQSRFPHMQSVGHTNSLDSSFQNKHRHSASSSLSSSSITAATAPAATKPQQAQPKATPQGSRWFHGLMERQEAVQRLKECGGDCFLVRQSTTREGSYTLSFVHRGQLNHYKVNIMDDGKVRMPGNKDRFNTLAELVTFHQKTPLSKDGKLLGEPCPRP